MLRIKKTYDDYAVYFKEGRLNDSEIAKELGVSRVNVGKMRRKWESLKDDPHYYITNTSKLTISENTFNNMLARSFKIETQANRLKNQVEIEKNKIAFLLLIYITPPTLSFSPLIHSFLSFSFNHLSLCNVTSLFSILNSFPLVNQMFTSHFLNTIYLILLPISLS
ncbi:DUF603 domain-containing protein (plasmid) [Borrelia miyamotoi]|nr:DUF603 domain-containing protein [Borrelia miyamotoi]ATQ15568.2 DUF603 domain-containing protein [Borrelia miyamotoi]ATQ16589.2 DUF603 domain-containing protein [Borrelia miyamotoi]ATQ17762.2 DUF603 domain-containing protein [Borrelia miyamotoi]ATQ18982.2 DUF603 domain-containing protein [Borrelia miyamotoi]ATQ20278.2 DUF603 domain-containing protein [Borrelia miyamotoi]